MPYCPECDTTESEGRYCPECGTEMVQPSDEASARAGSEPLTESGREPTRDYFQKGPIGFSFSYPIADGWTPILITAGLIFFSWLLIPYLFIYGYAYRLGRAAMRGDSRPPEYDDWVGLLVDGVLLIVVMIPYMLVIAVFVGIPFALAISLESIGIGLLAGVLYFVAIYVGAGILPTFMATGSVVETYRGLRFLEFVRTMSYLKALALIVILSIVISIIVGIVALILLITIIGILLLVPLYLLVGPFVTFLPFLMFAYYYREALEKEEVSPMSRSEELGAEF